MSSEGETAPWSLEGRVVMVTGANTGIGRATALALAARRAHVVLVCRNAERGKDALAEVRRAGGGDASAELLAIDLASFQSIRSGAAAFLARHDRLHVLINNAGIWPRRRELTEDGFESTFAVNQLAPFLLTALLLPVLEASAPARIVNVASRIHRSGHMRWDDLDFAGGFSSERAYSQSKLANVLWTRELARRLSGTGVVANSVHPGVVATELVRDLPIFVRGIFRLFGLTPEKGAEGSVRLAAAPELGTATGRYFERTAESTPSREGQDDEAAKRLWQICEQRTGWISDPRPARDLRAAPGT